MPSCMARNFPIAKTCLKLCGFCATLKPMTSVRFFAAIALIGFASTVTAQNIVITVVDQSGAVIPVARIGIVLLPGAALNQSDWPNYALHASEKATAFTDASGKAIVDLAKGSYAVSIAAPGFNRYTERIEVQDGLDQSLRRTLHIAVGICTVCLTPEIPIPLEHAPHPNNFIPLEPLQTITVTPIRVRRRWLRF